MAKIFLIVPSSDNWISPARSGFFIDVLEENGHTVIVHPAKEDQCPTTAQVAGCDLVINHAMQAPTEQINALADHHRDSVFVNLNHSALCHVERFGDKVANRLTSSLHAARNRKNVWYASQDKTAVHVGRSAGIERCIWFPVPGHVLSPRDYRPPASPACVVIAGRADPIKNNLMQMVACGLLRDRIKLTLCVNPNNQIKNALHALRLEVEILGRLPHAQWIEFLRTRADLVMSCSLAESYGFVASEAMQSGVPIVSTDVVRFADPAAIAPTHNAELIAAKMVEVLDDHEAFSAHAVGFAESAAKEQVTEYLATIDFLCSTAVRREGG